MILYHATPYRNLPRIIAGGLQTHFGEIYFADSVKAAALFVALRYEHKIAVIPMEFEEHEVRESFDHNENLLKNLFKNVDTESLKYIQVTKEEAAILHAAASYGIRTLLDVKRAINSQRKGPTTNRRKRLAIPALSIFEKYTKY